MPPAKSINYSKPSTAGFAVFLFACFSSAVPVSAQRAPEADQEEERIELSPFQVTASEDMGYLATSTLAGTRIKSNIRDVGSTISIITKEFLEDTGVKNASELLIYTAGTETGGVLGNFSSVGLSTRFGEANPGPAQRAPQFATRVRGIAAPDLTRDYFLTRIPFDSYNTDRVEINRGANAILFGLGSPVGILNQGLSKPVFDDFGEINVRFGEHGSFRSSLMLNHELVEGKLAVRAAVLHDREEYHQRPAFEQQDRIYGAVTWRPFDNTRFKFNAERGKIDANRPNPVAYSENISAWMLSGNPIHDNTPLFLMSPKGAGSGAGRLDKPFAEGGTRHPGLPANRVIDLGAGSVLRSADANRAGWSVTQGFWQFQSAAAWSNYNLVRPDMSLDHLAGTDLPNPALPSGPHPLDLDPDSTSGTPILFFMIPEPINFMYGPGFNTQGLNDRRAFDWVNNLLFGDVPFQNSDFKTFNAAIEQTFLNNKAGFEIAFDHQEMSDFSLDPGTELRGAIHIDTNVTLPVTPAGINQPNPNYLRPYTFASMRTNERQEERNVLQGTGFYEFDFREKMNSRWGDWLGRHVLTGIYTDQKIELESLARSSRWTDPLLLRQSGSFNALGVQALAQQFVYLGPPIDPNADSMDDIKINRLNGPKLYDPSFAYPITHWEPGVQPGTTNQRANGTNLAGAQQILAIGGPTGMGNIVTQNVPYEMLIGGVTLREEKIDSIAANLQSYWLSEKLVTTVGWRRDEVTLHQIGRGDLPKDVYNQTVVTGAKATDDDSPVTVSDDTVTWSVVGYWPDRFFELPFDSTLSVHYSESSNFQPSVGRIDEFGNNLDNPTGDTKEYGFVLSMFDNKFFVRVNWYETALLNASAPLVSFGTVPTLGIRWFAEAARNSEDLFAVTGLPEHAASAALGDAALEVLRAATPSGFREFWNVKELKNEEGKIIGYTDSPPNGISDTQDVAAEGTEIELVYNPTPSWRLMLNLTRQKAVKSNVNPVSRAWRDWAVGQVWDAPIPGTDLTLGDLPGISMTEYFPDNPPETKFGQAWANSGGDTIRSIQHLNFGIPLDTLVSQEGALSQELREWRLNLITTYDFRHGPLEGFTVGGAWRYQSKVAIGYEFMDVDGDGVLDAADVDKPHWGPDEHGFDVWANYKMPFFREYGAWSVGVNVRNVFASADDIIPIQTHTNGAVARVRFAPQRAIYLSSKFEF